MWKNIPGLSECEGASKGQIKLYYTNKYKLHIFYYQKTSCTNNVMRKINHFCWKKIFLDSYMIRTRMNMPTQSLKIIVLRRILLRLMISSSSLPLLFISFISAGFFHVNRCNVVDDLMISNRK